MAYGARKRVTATEKKLLKQPDAPIALGRGGARNERGISTSGAIGEVFKEGHDPQHNTAVQRSWVYQPDPMLKVRAGSRSRSRSRRARARAEEEISRKRRRRS